MSRHIGRCRDAGSCHGDGRCRGVRDYRVPVLVHYGCDGRDDHDDGGHSNRGRGSHNGGDGGGDDNRDHTSHSGDSRGRTSHNSAKDNTKGRTIRNSPMISKPNLYMRRVTMRRSNTKDWSMWE